MRGRAHGSRKNGFLLTGLRAISSALSRHRSRRLRVRISVGFSTKRHEFRRFDAVRSWLPIDRRRCQTNYLLPPPSPRPSPPRRTHSTLANISRTVIRSQVSFRITKSVSRENFSIIAKYGNINMSSTSRIRNALSLESFLSNLIKHIYIFILSKNSFSR